MQAPPSKGQKLRGHQNLHLNEIDMLEIETTRRHRRGQQTSRSQKQQPNKIRNTETSKRPAVGSCHAHARCLQWICQSFNSRRKQMRDATSMLSAIVCEHQHTSCHRATARNNQLVQSHKLQAHRNELATCRLYSSVGLR